MEEKKVKKNHIYLKIAIVVFVVAAILIFSGVMTTIKNATNAMENGMPGNGEIVFDNDMSYSWKGTLDLDADQMFTGFALIAGGMFCVFIGIVLVVTDMHKNKTLTSLSKKMIDGVVGAAGYISSSIGEMSREIKEKRKVYCEYCGSQLEEDESKCPNCGASKKSIK